MSQGAPSVDGRIPRTRLSGSSNLMTSLAKMCQPSRIIATILTKPCSLAEAEKSHISMLVACDTIPVVPTRVGFLAETQRCLHMESAPFQQPKFFVHVNIHPLQMMSHFSFAHICTNAVSADPGRHWLNSARNTGIQLSLFRQKSPAHQGHKASRTNWTLKSLESLETCKSTSTQVVEFQKRSFPWAASKLYAVLSGDIKVSTQKMSDALCFPLELIPVGLVICPSILAPIRPQRNHIHIHTPNPGDQ